MKEIERRLGVPWSAIIVVAVVTALRLAVAFRVPLSGDEVDHWIWGRHLAFGYVDHPPAETWLIWLISALGPSPGIVRLPFILCETVAALVLGRTAFMLSGNLRVAGAAAIAFCLIPELKVATGAAGPDGPYLLCWALALALVVRLEARPSAWTAVALGLALAGAILSRFFGWALIAGIVAYGLTDGRRPLWRQGLAVAIAVALAIYIPFVATARGCLECDGQTFYALSFERLGHFSTVQFLLYGLPLLGIGALVAIRERLPLIAWTALPFPALLIVVALFTKVQPYWLLGPFASLCVAFGITFAQMTFGLRRIVAALASIPAIATTALALFIALPEDGQAAILRRYGPTAKGLLYSEVFVFPLLAADVRRLSAGRAQVMTDRHEIASELYYYGLRSTIIGGTARADRWNRSPDVSGDHLTSRRVLVVLYSPLESDSPTALRLRRACGRVVAGPVLRHRYGGANTNTFYTAWCEQIHGDAPQVLYGSQYPTEKS